MEIKQTDDEEKEKHSDVQKDVYVKSSENVCDLDNIKEQVAGMLSKENTEDQSEKKISRLQLMLKLLEEDQVEQSVGKEKAAGGSIPIHKISETKPPDGTAHGSEQISPKAAGSMLICKMSETKPPDGTAHGSEQISPKAAGGGMPIHKMSETKPPDGNASENTDVKGSTAKSLPEKPPLHVIN